MSIWASTLTIEDERQWVAELQEAGIGAGVIRDGEPDFDDLDAPIIYKGSHVLPEEDHPRGGSVGLAIIPPHVRYWRENPNGVEEPEGTPYEPFLRLDVQAHGDTDGGPADATVVLTRHQVERLRDALAEFLENTETP